MRAASAPSTGLRELFAEPRRFSVLTEVVPWRGTLDDDAGARARSFARDLGGVPGIEAISVTDGAGGRLVLSAETLAEDLAASGHRVLVHVSCRDRNRNELAALAWRLGGAGLTDLLVLSGDYPHEGYLGVARPVFDLDSVSLLQLYATLGRDGAGAGVLARPPARDVHRDVGGLVAAPAGRGPHQAVPLHLGAAVNPFKALARDAVPQYLKLELKARAGARFAITQSGYDARKLGELARFVADRTLPLRLLQSVFVLSAGSARAFHAGRVPGVEVSDDLLAVAERYGASPDKGRAFFLELAAKQLVVARGLGYVGAVLSGLSRAADVERVLDLAAAHDPADWRSLLPEVSWSRPDSFWLYPPDPPSDPPGPSLGPADPVPGDWPAPRRRPLPYLFGRWAHRAFTPGSPWFAALKRVVDATEGRPAGRALHRVEQVIKLSLYDCRDCGDCSLPDIAFLCPESQCVKNQRNGPCGGSRDGECEVPGQDCIWARAYDRFAADGAAASMLDRPVAVQDNALRRTSAWANALAGRDLHGRRSPVPDPAPALPVAQLVGP
jgi:methylenetetrahydrofolate reductase (NADPH)